MICQFDIIGRPSRGCLFEEGREVGLRNDVTRHKRY